MLSPPTVGTLQRALPQDSDFIAPADWKNGTVIKKGSSEISTKYTVKVKNTFYIFLWADFSQQVQGESEEVQCYVGDLRKIVGNK